MYCPSYENEWVGISRWLCQHLPLNFRYTRTRKHDVPHDVSHDGSHDESRAKKAESPARRH
jgi:hypothetical protein